MQGTYRVFAGNQPCELIDVKVTGHTVTINGPIWCGRGVLIDGVYCGSFEDVIGDGHGTHRARPGGDVAFDVEADFVGGLRMELQWRPESQ